MRLRSINLRLTAAAIAAVLVAVLILGIGARIVVTNRLHSSLDDSLRSRAVEVARLAVSAPAVLTEPGALESPISGRQLSVEVIDRHEALISRSLALGAKLLPRGPEVSAALAGRSSFADADLDGEPFRVYAAPIAEAGGAAAGGAVLVAASTADIEDTLHELTLLLLLCGVAAVLVGGLAAALLTRAGTRPLRRLSSSAATIERTGDAARRLDAPATPEEVSDLARTLNSMLSALEDSRERERRFLADASHELRTPLTALIGNVEYLARHGADAELIAALEEDADRLRRLVEDLLVLERESAARSPERRLRLDRAIEELGEADADLVVRVDGPATVVADPVALERSFRNLLENARVHGPPGGRVSVALATADGLAQVTVTDEGAGFAAGTEEEAFERFWRGESSRERPGSGIGLAIVKATAERHGGSVSAAGSTVTISLPTVDEIEPDQPSASGGASARLRRRRTIQ